MLKADFLDQFKVKCHSKLGVLFLYANLRIKDEILKKSAKDAI
jgi:hypothetical protein